MGVLYVLDEPSIGLHPRDNAPPAQTLMHLRDLGNTVLVVEHDEETIRSADWILDLGPGRRRTRRRSGRRRSGGRHFEKPNRSPAPISRPHALFPSPKAPHRQWQSILIGGGR
jgi:energy-coupling factor transporter ATP-binding protein EcfA2